MYVLLHLFEDMKLFFLVLLFQLNLEQIIVLIIDYVTVLLNGRFLHMVWNFDFCVRFEWEGVVLLPTSPYLRILHLPNKLRGSPISNQILH